MSSSIVVGLIIATFIALAIIKIVKDRKNGKHSCNYGGSCGGCPMAGQCHQKKSFEK